MEDNEVIEGIIPENSPTISLEETTSRFSSAVWYEAIRSKAVTLIGCGGINSWLALLLSRLKINKLTIYDNDKVDLSNMSGQLFKVSDVGNYKVDSIVNTMREYSNFYNVLGLRQLYNETSSFSKIMMCGVDNMEARKTAFYTWYDAILNCDESYKKECLFIDGRLSATDLQVFAIQGNDDRAIEVYKDKWLFSDYEAEETICSFKQTTYMANMIASIMTNIFVNFVANEVDKVVPREVPFFTTYSSDNMFFKVEV